MYRARIFLRSQPVKAKGIYSVSITENFILKIYLCIQTNKSTVYCLCSLHHVSAHFYGSNHVVPQFYLKQKVYQIEASALQELGTIISIKIIVSNSGTI